VEESLLSTSGPVVEADVFLEADHGLASVVSPDRERMAFVALTRSRSKSLSHGVVRGKFGSTKYAILAITTVTDPSMMNSHLEEAY